MTFYKETGLILATNGDILSVLDGTIGNVVFPREMLLEFHEKTPGLVSALVHTHPPDFPHLSHEDKTTLQAWASAFYPYPIRMITICQMGENKNSFMTSSFYGFLETKEQWQERGKKTPRTFEIFKNSEHLFPYDEAFAWEKMLIDRSYGLTT